MHFVKNKFSQAHNFIVPKCPKRGILGLFSQLQGSGGSLRCLPIELKFFVRNIEAIWSTIHPIHIEDSKRCLFFRSTLMPNFYTKHDLKF